MPFSNPALKPGLVPKNGFVPLIIMAGESNACGQASNTPLTAAQLAALASVQILNNTTLTFQPLQVGTNNTIDCNVTDNATHGWEVQLADAVDAGQFAPFGQVYMVKAGFGGAHIVDWDAGGTYSTKWLARVNAAMAALTALGLRPLPVIWYSQGINDNTGIDFTLWRNKTLALFSRWRAVVGYCPILMTQLPPAYTGVASNLDLITGGVGNGGNGYDKFTVQIGTSGLTLGDAFHWDSPSIATIASSMIAQTLSLIGVSGNENSDGRMFALNKQIQQLNQIILTPLPSIAGGTFSSSQAVSLTCPLAGASIYYTLDGSTPTNTSTLYTGPITISATQTLSAIAYLGALGAGSVFSANYAITVTGPVTWTLKNGTISGNLLLGGSGQGGIGSVSIDPTKAFRVAAALPSSAAELFLIYLDTENTSFVAYPSAHPVVAGFYGVGGNSAVWFPDVSGGGATSGAYVLGANLQLSLLKSGNDVLFQTSTDAGVTWTTTKTFSGVLTGKTSVTPLYVKAVSAGASKQIAVTLTA